MSMEVPVGDTYYFKFTTRSFSTGVPTTLAGTPVISIYEENNAVQITAGVTLSADYDGVTGLNDVAVVASSANGYEVGKYYNAVITTGTVGGVSVVGETVGHFRVMPAEDAGAGIKDVNVTHVSDTTEDLATETKQNTAQTDLDTITGSDGVTLATAQALYAPSKAGDAMALSAGAITNASLAGNMEIVFETDFATNYNQTDNAWVTNGTSFIGTGWNVGKTGYSLSATGLDAIASTATGMVEIAKAIWDRVLSAATHNIANSAGRRLRQLQTGGNYELGGIWIDTVNGTAGTTVDENGVVTNPVDNIADALTLGASTGLRKLIFYPGSDLTGVNAPAASLAGYILEGADTPIDLNGQSVEGSVFTNMQISGTGTGTAEYFVCKIGLATLGPGRMIGCGLGDGGSALTFGSAGNFDFIDSYSLVAGSGSPTVDVGVAVGACNVAFRRLSGGLILNNLAVGDVVTIGGSDLGTVTLNGADASVEIRGIKKATVNNLTGSPTVNDTALLKSDIDAILVDTGTDIPARFDGIEGATFNTSTDSLEAIRNRGDAAWTTGAGGTPPQLLQSTTIATLTSQTSFTLTAGSSDNDAYNGAIAVITDSATSEQKAVGTVSDYTGSTKRVILSADPAIFTMAVGDTIEIIAALGSGGGGDATSANQTTIINHLTDIKGATWDSTNSLEAIHDDLDAVTGADGVNLAASQANTVTFPAVNITGLLNIDDGIDVSATTVDRDAIKLVGNGAGNGLDAVGGTTGGNGVFAKAGASSNSDGIRAEGSGTGEGFSCLGGANGHGALFQGGGSAFVYGAAFVGGGSVSDISADIQGTIDTVPTAAEIRIEIDTNSTELAALQAPTHLNKQADHVLRRNSANARASADGDAVNFRSPLGAVSKLTNKVGFVGTDLVTREENDTTAFGTQAATTDATADPVTDLDTV